MKRWVLRLAGLGMLLAIGGFLVSASGIIPIKASSGHWPITEWFLHFSMRRSIATHSLFIRKPDLEEPGRVLRGAGHYDLGCRSCHGSPADDHPRIALQMTPHPPALEGRIPEWDPEELFYVVKHGVKFTGMPAWAAQEREDEVWDVVAFLLKLPTLDASEYRRLSGGEAKPLSAIEAMDIGQRTARAVNFSCVRCHGADGRGGEKNAFPVLAGQRREYLENALHAYANGQRHSGVMGPVAAALAPETIKELSAYYSRLEPGTTSAESTGHPAAVERGRIIAEQGIRENRVPACLECHSSLGNRTKSAYPLIAGQPAWYLRSQLELFRGQARGGSEYAHVMEEIAVRLNKKQIADVAAYLASLPPERPKSVSSNPEPGRETP